MFCNSGLVLKALWSSLWCVCYSIVLLLYEKARNRLLCLKWPAMVPPIGIPQQRGFTPKTPPRPRLEAAGEEHPGDTESGGRCCRSDARLLRKLELLYPVQLPLLKQPQSPLHLVGTVVSSHRHHSHNSSLLSSVHRNANILQLCKRFAWYVFPCLTKNRARVVFREFIQLLNYFSFKKQNV